MYTKPSKILTAALTLVLALAGTWLALRFLLPWLAPFLLALGLAALMEPAVGALCLRWRWKRGAAAGLCTLAFVSAAAGLVWLLCSRLGVELGALLQRLPEILGSVSATLSSWQARLARLLDGAGVSAWMNQVSRGFYAFLSGLPGLLSEKLLGLLSAFAGAAPSVLLFLVTALIGTYFVSASYPELLRFVRRQLPPRFAVRAAKLCRDLRRTLGRWLRAQLIMMLITFAELTLAFALLRVNYALVLALVTAVIDALPVLGTGTVLIPWALYSFLTGDVARGVGLAVTYGAVTLLRSCIQAKLLGDQLGLHPLATLVSIYVGWRVWGVWGMVLFPILAISLKQLNDSGILRLWKTEENEGEEVYDRDRVQYPGRHGHEHSGRHEYPSG